MIVAVDGSAWTHATGFGRYVRELVGALAARHADIHVRLVVPTGVPPRSIPPAVTLVELHAGASSATQGRSVRTLLASLRAYATMEADLVWMPSLLGYVPVLRVPERRRVPIVIGVHDAIAHQFSAELFDRRHDAIAWRLKTRAALMQATRIVTVSAHARTRLIEVLGVAADRVRIVGEAAAPVFVPAPPDVARATVARIGQACGVTDLETARLVVYHGAFARHKNLLRLVEAFSAIVTQPDLADVRLVLVGGRFRGTAARESDGRGDGDVPAVEAALIELAAARAPGRILFAGRLEDEPLRDLLSAATVAVLPSLEEGYGLTAIEASACGAAVIATRHSAMPDVLGDGALIIDPLDTAALTEALTRLLRDEALRRTICDRARRRQADLTWTRAADELAEVFREVVAR